MATSRTVATPGQDPTTTDTGTTDTQADAQVTSTTASTTDTGGESGTGADASLQAQLDEMKATTQAMAEQNAALAEQVKALLSAGLRTAQAQSPAPVPLPSIDDKAVRASTVPVLTKDGWFVPESKVWQVTAGAKAA